MLSWAVSDLHFWKTKLEGDFWRWISVIQDKRSLLKLPPHISAKDNCAWDREGLGRPSQEMTWNRIRVDLEQDQRDGGVRTSERRGTRLYTSSDGAAETTGVGRMLTYTFNYILSVLFSFLHSFVRSFFPFFSFNNFETE